MTVTPYFGKSTGIKFGKFCLSPLSRCRGVHELSNENYNMLDLIFSLPSRNSNDLEMLHLNKYLPQKCDLNFK